CGPCPIYCPVAGRSGHPADLLSLPARRASDRGDWVDAGIDWLKTNLSWLFDLLRTVMSFLVDNLTELLLLVPALVAIPLFALLADRKSTRLNSSHVKTSYAVFC